jgi:catechol 2,3-dioxygenase-like lactoylglutathione lyase family enzyme
MLSVVELTQTRLIVSDFAASFRYYRDVLGLRPQFEPAGPPYAAFKPEAGGTARAARPRRAGRPARRRAAGGR